MTRYAEWNKFIGNLKTDTWGVTNVNEVGIAFEKATADVVPKSEYDEVLSSWQKIHDSYDADCIEHYKYGRAEVARKIFEEIEQWLGNYNGCRVITYEKFAELKKKYTEEN